MFRIIALSLLLFASHSLQAETSQTAGNLIQVTAKRMLSQIEENRGQINDNPRHVYDLVNEILLPHIDFERMSRWVLGKHWRRASSEEKQEFVAEFRKLIIRTYSTALLEFSGQEIRFLPVRDQSDPNRASVRTEIRPASGPMIPISYDLYRNDAGEWKVYDVAIDGISLIANYRSSFGSQIRRTGGLTRVINRMKSRSQQAKK
ncbi:MAG: ABC transporter substrate-binding protein [Sulfuriflexus sp.]|nr:ABC transporter substrate-binding protein [Sulfuriflexus sp.]